MSYVEVYTDAPATTVATFHNRSQALVTILQYTPADTDPQARKALFNSERHDLELRHALESDRYAALCTGCLTRYPVDEVVGSDRSRYLRLADGRKIYVARHAVIRAWAQDHADTCSARPPEQLPTAE